jgi:hypothetical protein
MFTSLFSACTLINNMFLFYRMSKKNCKYSQEDLTRALNAIKNGTPCATASKRYKIPRTTLIGKIKGIYPEECRSGAPSVLTANEENILSEWIINIGRMGFPVSKDQLLDSVSLLVKNLGRSNHFTNGRPGRHWYELFSKRHPDISERIAQNLCASRAAVTKCKIQNWHKEVEDYFISSGINITDPKRIFNTDESAFFLSPKGRKVLAKKGSKSLHDRSGDDKECLTVLITGNAAGQLAPPMVMYSYERLPKHIVSHVPNGWGVGKSKSGWMTSESFFEYITNIFYPWLVSENVEFPVILYLDGHKSHVTLPLTDFCRQKQIVVISLLPNSTHILQPLDVGLFKSLKSKWKHEVKNFKINNNYKNLTKDAVAPVLDKSLKSISNIETIFKNSFKACGLFPFNADNIDYSKLLYDEDNDSLREEKQEDSAIVQHLRYLESYIEPEVLNKCYELMGAEWTGKSEDRSLYSIWYKMYLRSGLSYNKEKLPNVTIDIEEGLILEEGWENLIVFNDNEENDNLATEEIPPLVCIEGEPDMTEAENNMNVENMPNVLHEKASAVKVAETEVNYLKEAEKESAIIHEIEKVISNEFEMENNNSILEDTSDMTHEKTPAMNVTETERKKNIDMLDISTEKESSMVEVENTTSNVTEVSIETIEERLGNMQNTPKKYIDIIENEPPREQTIESAEGGYPRSSTKPSPLKLPSGVLVPSPFKKSLFWPEPTKKVKSRKSRVKVPSVGTSDAWRAYFLKKEEQKRSIQEKEERKRKREENKKLREKRNKKQKKKVIQQDAEVEENIEAPSETEEDLSQNVDESENGEAVEVQIGDFVIVNYLDEYYPAKVTDKDDEKVLANAMAKAAGDKWKWPSIKDEIWYDYSEIIQKIEPPVEINRRGFFSVKDLKFC